MSADLGQHQPENTSFINRFIILRVDDFGLERVDRHTPEPADQHCSSPWKAPRDGSSHNLPASPSSRAVTPPANSPTPAGPSGPGHPTLWDAAPQLWEMGPPPPFWTSGWVPKTQTALLLSSFFSSSSKLTNVNNQKNMHMETYFSTPPRPSLLPLPAETRSASQPRLCKR